MALSSSFSTVCMFFVTLTLMPTTPYCIPFVVFHGIEDACRHKGVERFTEILANWSGTQGHCVEIGNGAWDSWFMPFPKQISIACEKVKKISELRDGYNIVGLSQGNMVGRGVIEFCDEGPPFEQDEVLVPKETSLFGYYPDGSWCTVLPVEGQKQHMP